ncbi:MAG: M16 family metallopeptidase [Desulfosalsimonas sp.]
MKSKILFRHKNLLIFLFVAVAASIALRSAPSFAEKGEPANPQEYQARCWPHEKSDLAPDPEVDFGTLENGIRYVIKKNDTPEDRVRMHLVVDAGSFHETEEQRGIAHFLEHMLFNGTGNFPPGELVKYFQRIGMAFGPDVNGRTGFYQTVYDLDLPDGEKETLREAMLVMHDFAAEALLKQKEVKKERHVILSEKQTRDSSDYRTFKKTLKFELSGARIPERLPIGIEEAIRSADRELIKDFYDTWYRPENLTLVMVGDFETKTAEKILKDRFDGLQARAPQKPDPEFGKVGHKGIKPFYHHESEAGKTRVTIETAEKEPMPQDSAQYQRERILAKMANKIIDHRLNAVLEEPDAPFTDAWISSGHYLRFVKSAEISADCRPENWQKAFSAIEKELRKALEHGFTESEVTRVQKEYITRLRQAVKNSATRRSRDLAQELISSLSDNRVYQSPKQRLEMLEPAVNSATQESLHKAFKKEWNAAHRLLLVTGNADLSDAEKTPEKQIKSAYEQSRSRPVKKPEKGRQVEFPYLLPPAGQGKISTKKDIEDLGITRVAFENGVDLLIKETDFKDNQVLAAVSFGQGESAEPEENPALAEMTSEVINLSGLGELSRENLKQALADKNTSVSFDAEEDKFVFSAVSVPEETRLMFELLYSHIKDPAFRVSARKQAINKFRQRYKSLSHTVQGAMELEGMRFLAGGDPRFGLPPLEAIENTGLEDVRNWIKPVLENAPLEIAVVGDINQEQVIREAARFFGGLTPRKKKAHIPGNNPPKFPEGQEIEISVPTRISKALLVAAYPSTDIWDIGETRRLSVLSRIFSDRMRIKIREEMGAAYSRAAFNKPSRAYHDYGIFAGYVITDPEKIPAVEEAVKEIAADLHKNGADEDELTRALKPTLTGIREQLETNQYWLDTVLKGASRHPEQLEWSRSIKEDYKKITVSDVNRMAEKYLINQGSATIRIRSEIPPHADGKVNREK